MTKLIASLVGCWILLFVFRCPVLAGLNPVTTGTINSKGVFFANGSQLFLRGSNYIVLDDDGHCLFEPSLYSSSTVETALEEMHDYGYNYVRVFLSCPTLQNGFGLNSPGVPASYYNNVADFLNRAANNGIYVILTGDDNPANYSSIANSYPIPANVSGMNYYTLHLGQAAAKAQFFHDLLTGLKTASPNGFTALWAIDIYNEICVSVHDEPYNETSGTFTFNGVDYDLSNATQRQNLVDVSGAYWMNTVAKAIKAVAPGVLVTASVFPPDDVGHAGFDGVAITPENADKRYPLRPVYMAANSNEDFVDIHQYVTGDNQSPSIGTRFNDDQLSQTTPLSKPLVLGEYGAFYSGYSTAAHAEWALGHLLILSASYGFTGWGIWTFNTSDEYQTQAIWALTDDGAALANDLSPDNWPDIQQQYFANGTYSLTPGNASALHLNVKGAGTTNGTAVDVETSTGAANQKWNFSYNGNGTYRLTPSNATAECLDVKGAGTANGTPLQIWGYGAGLNQTWLPLPNADGSFMMVPCHATSSPLEVSGGGTSSGTAADISYQVFGDTAQEWKITQ